MSYTELKALENTLRIRRNREDGAIWALRVATGCHATVTEAPLLEPRSPWNRPIRHNNRVTRRNALVPIREAVNLLASSERCQHCISTVAELYGFSIAYIEEQIEEVSRHKRETDVFGADIPP